MKIAFLGDISDGGRYIDVKSESLIRLYDFDVAEAIRLRDLLQQTVVDEQKSLDLTAQSFIVAVNCNLFFLISAIDIGITTTDQIIFNCKVNLKAYKSMIHMIEPFCEADLSVYNYQTDQWLYDLDTPIDFYFHPMVIGDD